MNPLNVFMISYKTKSNDFPPFSEWDLDQHKIPLFKEQIEGWQLDISRYLLFGTPEKNIEPHPHAAYGALSILVSYFENIARFIEGCMNDNTPGTYFKRGVLYVYTGTDCAMDLSKANLLYKRLRCGLHHMGISKSKVILSENITTTLLFHNDQVIISPRRLYEDVDNHFKNYIKQLASDKKLRKNFENRFNWVKEQ